MRDSFSFIQKYKHYLCTCWPRLTIKPHGSSRSTCFPLVCCYRYVILRTNHLSLELFYFLFVLALGFLILKAIKPRSPNFQPMNLDLFFSSVSASTVSSMSTVEMEVFSNAQHLMMTGLMFIGGEVFTSMVGIHLRGFKPLKSSKLALQLVQLLATLSGFNTYQIVVGVLFQTTNARHTGESIVDLSAVAPAILVVFVVMMSTPFMYHMWSTAKCNAQDYSLCYHNAIAASTAISLEPQWLGNCQNQFHYPNGYLIDIWSSKCPKILATDIGNQRLLNDFGNDTKKIRNAPLSKITQMPMVTGNMLKQEMETSNWVSLLQLELGFTLALRKFSMTPAPLKHLQQSNMATKSFLGNFPFNTYHETFTLENQNVVQRLGNVFTLRHSKLHAADLLNRIDNFQFASQVIGSYSNLAASKFMTLL
ncbi:uncharacterized protein [Coffea arabica]|uniref:Uncharacterized protein n=1 Tax=Coffea arabica TaxID=13443 RepID=A0ABM4US02_COFAR